MRYIEAQSKCRDKPSCELHVEFMAVFPRFGGINVTDVPCSGFVVDLPMLHESEVGHVGVAPADGAKPAGSAYDSGSRIFEKLAFILRIHLRVQFFFLLALGHKTGTCYAATFARGRGGRVRRRFRMVGNGNIFGKFMLDSCTKLPGLNEHRCPDRKELVFGQFNIRLFRCHELLHARQFYRVSGVGQRPNLNT